jgi:hypothetical protein
MSESVQESEQRARARRLEAFAAELRALRADSGRNIGIRQLALRVVTSKTSLTGYLNGKRLPPVEVLEALMNELAAEPARRDRIRALWAAVDDPPPETEGERRAYFFAGVGHAEAAALAATLRANWAEGRQLMARRQANPPQVLDLRSWLEKVPCPDAVRALDRPGPPDRSLAELVTALDPGRPPVFAGWTLDRPGLFALARQAIEAPQSAEAQLLHRIHEDGILTVFDGQPGTDRFAEIDGNWHRQALAANSRLDSLCLYLPPDTRTSIAGLLLLLCLDDDPSRQLAREMLADQPDEYRTAIEQPWFLGLLRETTPPDFRPAHEAVLWISRRTAAAQTRQAREENDRDFRDVVLATGRILFALGGFFGGCLFASQTWLGWLTIVWAVGGIYLNNRKWTTPQSAFRKVTIAVVVFDFLLFVMWLSVVIGGPTADSVNQ